MVVVKNDVVSASGAPSEIMKIEKNIATTSK